MKAFPLPSGRDCWREVCGCTECEVAGHIPGVEKCMGMERNVRSMFSAERSLKEGKGRERKVSAENWEKQKGKMKTKWQIAQKSF